MKHQQKTANRIVSPVLAILLSLVLALPGFMTVSNFTNVSATEATFNGFREDYASYAEEQKAAGLHNEKLAEESYVLMKNGELDAAAGTAKPLPIPTKDADGDSLGVRVSVFGTRMDNIILGGSGSGGGSAPDAYTVQQSLEAAGFTLNPALVKLYAQTTATSELPVSALDSVAGTYRFYHDAAIIVISRTGSEFNDAAMWNVPGHSDPLDQYYSLDDNEKALVKLAKKNFSKVIVVINSAHPMELGELNDKREDEPASNPVAGKHYLGVDAIVWMGHPGKTGAMALGKILAGTVNPSGHTSDVYPRKFANDPTWANFKGNIQGQLNKGTDGNAYIGDPANKVLAPAIDTVNTNSEEYMKYARVQDKDGKYVIVDGPNNGANYYAVLDYEESIYVGYKWYETAYEEIKSDKITSGTVGKTQLISKVGDADATAQQKADAWWKENVVYPHGYGLSYNDGESTDYEWKITKVEVGTATFNKAAQITDTYAAKKTFVADTAAEDAIDVTSSEQSITLSADQLKKDIQLTLSVKNRGTVAGKDVGQIYVTAPYWSADKTAHTAAEKSAVSLVEFVKSDLLEISGEKNTQTLKVAFKAQDLASWDITVAHNGTNCGQSGCSAKGAYVLDAGDYELGVYTDSHNKAYSVKFNVAAQIQFFNDSTSTSTSKKHVKNRITPSETEWAGTRQEGSLYWTGVRSKFVSKDDPMVEMTRATFGTYFPAAPTVNALKFTDDALKILGSNIYYTGFNDFATDPWYQSSVPTGWDQATKAETEVNEAPTAAKPYSRKDGKTKVQLKEMRGVAFDDAKWTTFMNQLTYDEMVSLISSTRFMTAALPAIGKVAEKDADGPAQFSTGTFWTCEVNIASTYNKELAYQQGKFVGNESLFLGVDGWYGPGMNIHRNPAAGRNFEYYSQDGVHNGLIAAAVIKGATEYGIKVYMKHLLLNDQETSRYTASTFVGEQALREIYMKPWELAIKYGNANAYMRGFNRIGLIANDAHWPVMIGLMEQEFGFMAQSVSDMYGWNYNPGGPGDLGARISGTPLGTWMDTFGRKIEGKWVEAKDGTGKVVLTFEEDITNGTMWSMTNEKEADGKTAKPNVWVAREADQVKDNAGNVTKTTQPAWISTGTALNAYVAPDESKNIKEKPANTYSINAINNKASAAYKDATSMKDTTHTTLYAKGDEIDSYTQWYAVRRTAQKLLYAAANANTQENDVDVFNFLSKYDGKTIEIQAGTSKEIKSGTTGASYETTSVLPAGLTLSVDGTLTAASTVVPGEYSVNITERVSNENHNWVQSTAAAKIKVTPLLTLKDNKKLEAAKGEAIAVQFEQSVFAVDGTVAGATAQNKITAVKYSLVNAVAGLALAEDGKLSGSIAQPGNYNLTVRVAVSYTYPGARKDSTVNFDSTYTLKITGTADPLTQFKVENGAIMMTNDGGKTWIKVIDKSELKGDTGAQGAAGKDAPAPAPEGGCGGSVETSGIVLALALLSVLGAAFVVLRKRVKA